MKIQIILAIIGFAIQAVSSKKKGFFGFSMPTGQFINMNNIANSNSNALAINTSGFGNANAISSSTATNYNSVGQSS